MSNGPMPMTQPARNPDGGRRLRVLVVASLYPHAKNETIGLSTHRRDIELAKLCDVKVLALTDRSDLPETETLDGVEVFRPRWRRVPKLGVFVDGYRYATRLARIVGGVSTRRGSRDGDVPPTVLPESFEFDLIDAHWLYPDGFAAVRLGRRLGKPVAVTGRGSDVNDYCSWWATRPFVRRTLRSADHLFAVSRRVKETMVEAGATAERITVVPNGVDTALFHFGERDAARRTLGLPLEERALISVGPMLHAKGFQHLIEGLRLLGQNEAGCLYILGPGPYRESLETLAGAAGLSARVRFLGRVAQKEMPLWYQAADFFCFGSLREGCPNVVLEALACGTPVVSSHVGGIPDLVEEGRSGVLFEPGSTEAFATALKTALARPWDRQAIAALGARRSWAHVAAEYARAFEQIVSRWSAKP